MNLSKKLPKKCLRKEGINIKRHELLIVTLHFIILNLLFYSMFRTKYGLFTNF